MRTRRLTAGIVAGLIGLAGLVGCRTDPTVAAYVGDEAITVDELESAVAERRADPELTTVGGPAYTRQVLTVLLRGEIHGAAAEQYGIEVTDAEVRELFEALTGGADPETVYAQAAAGGYSPDDVLESVRQQLLRQRIAEGVGLVDRVDGGTLRGQYEELLPQLTVPRLGYVNVPDQDTADQVVADLTADPASFPEVAAQYPEGFTTPEVRPEENVPQLIAQQVATSPPGTAFTVTASDVTGVLVVLVGEPEVPSFEEVRPRLEAQAGAEAAAAAQGLLAELEAELGVTINPRFGALEEGTVVEGDSHVVDILDEVAAGS